MSKTSRRAKPKRRPEATQEGPPPRHPSPGAIRSNRFELKSRCDRSLAALLLIGGIGGGVYFSSFLLEQQARARRTAARRSPQRRCATPSELRIAGMTQEINQLASRQMNDRTHDRAADRSNSSSGSNRSPKKKKKKKKRRKERGGTHKGGGTQKKKKKKKKAPAAFFDRPCRRRFAAQGSTALSAPWRRCRSPTRSALAMRRPPARSRGRCSSGSLRDGRAAGPGDDRNRRNNRPRLQSRPDPCHGHAGGRGH